MSLFRNNNDSAYEPLRSTKKIVVAGCGHCCGASFVSEIIAYGLSARFNVSVIELGKPHFYDALGFDEHFLIRGFTDYFERICSGAHIDYNAAEKNVYDNINWICKLPGSHPVLSTPELFRAFYLPNEEYLVFDCSGIEEDNTLALLAEADYPVIVVDPLPSSLLYSKDFLEKLRVKLPKSTIVVNKMNSGVHVRELDRFLGTKNYLSLAYYPEDLIYRAQYSRRSFCRDEEFSNNMKKAQDMLCRLFQ